jgi:hypothetical protein
MKKSLVILLVVLIVYAVLYVVVRVSFYDTVTMKVADTAGKYHPKTYKAVCFVVPVSASGFERHTKQILFGAFYPLGQLDHLLTGRLYWLVDMRNVTAVKSPPNTALEPTPTAP